MRRLMKKSLLTTGITSAAFCATLAVGNAAWADGTSCTHGDLERAVSVVYTEPGQPVPCEVVYEKPSEGGLSTPWRAQNEAGYCETQAQSLVEKLQGFGWDCEARDSTQDSNNTNAG